jgi:fructose/tagatose bisphosphate aldolase
MIVTTADLYKIAYGKYAIRAYNINNLEQTFGLFQGSIDSQAPSIIHLSKGARKYADKGMLEVIIRKVEEIFQGASEIFPRSPRTVRFPTALQNLCGRIREVCRPQERNT